MIRLNNNITTIIELGHGDVGICPGMQEENGIIGFKNQLPREIGSVEVERGETGMCVTDFPAILKFTDVRSIDVVIQALEVVREGMKNKNTGIKASEVIERCNAAMQGCENCNCTLAECLECLQEVHKLINWRERNE